MVFDPMQRGIGEEEIECLAAAETLDRRLLKGQGAGGKWRSLGQHLRGAVDAEGLRGPELLVHQPGELARAAAKVDDAHPRTWLDQSQQVVKGLAALRLETFVLLRVPHDSKE